MHEFMWPFRRKLGVLTLIVACCLMALWIRSFDTQTRSEDVFIFGASHYSCWSLQSEYGYINLVSPKEFRVEGPIVRQAPYWSVVIPLTLCSAYLLLSKPRSNQTQQMSHL